MSEKLLRYLSPIAIRFLKSYQVSDLPYPLMLVVKVSDPGVKIILFLAREFHQGLGDPHGDLVRVEDH